MARWSATTRTRRRRSALAYGSRSTAAAGKPKTGSYTTPRDANPGIGISEQPFGVVAGVLGSPRTTRRLGAFARAARGQSL